MSTANSASRSLSVRVARSGYRVLAASGNLLLTASFIYDQANDDPAPAAVVGAFTYDQSTDNVI